MYLINYDGSYDLKFGSIDDVDENDYIQAGLSLYENYDLIPDGKPNIALPSVKTNSIDIPGAMGTLNLSNFLTGYPVYKNRQGDLKFFILGEDSFREVKKRNFYAKFHGAFLNMVSPDDENKFYTGYFTVKSWEVDESMTNVVMSYDLEPYLYSREPSGLLFEGSDTRRYTPNRNVVPYSPEIILTTNAPEEVSTLEFANTELGISSTVKLKPGSNKLGSQFIISNYRGNNVNEIKITTSGSVTINYRNPTL